MVVHSVLSVMGLLLVATALSVITDRLRLPFSATLVVVGLALAELIRVYPTLAPLAQLQLSPELLIYILMPTLIFESAYSMDARMLQKNALPVMVLAVPSLIISFAAVGYGMHWLMGVPLGAALLFGALISPADGAAMLSIFRELGAPRRLTVLVEGENLFNDATPIVLFQILLVSSGVAGATAFAGGGGTVGGPVGSFFANFVGGLLAGAALGFACGKVIEYSEGNDLTEILLTTVVAYLSFLITEEVFGVSGIMAVVGTGVVLSGWGRTKFAPDTLAYLERFWDYLAFVANALVFLLVGLAIDLRSMAGMLEPIAWAVAITVAARALSIMGLFPVVNRLPGMERIGLPYQTAIVWGGLRGAISLALVMALPAEFPQRDLFLSLTVGVVLFSLLVQGLTLEPLMRRLGLHEPTLPEQYVRDETELAAKHRARQRIPELEREGIFGGTVVRELAESYEAEGRAIRERMERLREKRLGREEHFELLKREYLLVEKRAYLDLFHRGQLSEKVLKDLKHSIEVQIDHLRAGDGAGPKWTLHSPARSKIERSVFRLLEAVLPSNRVAERYRLNRIADLYEEHWGRLVATRRVLEELEQMKQEGRTSEEALAELEELYTGWHASARERLDSISEYFPEYATKVQQIMASRFCLQAEEEVIDEMERLGVLAEREADKLRADAQQRLRRLRQKPLEELRPRPRELLSKVPFFENLPAEEVDRVVELLRSRTVLAGEAIIREGEIGDTLYLIGRGIVRVTTEREGEEVLIATLHAGDFFGEMAIIMAEPRNATVTAASHCSLYELRRDDLDRLRRISPTVDDVLEATTRKRHAERYAPAGGEAD